jgi:hypothetical protein
MVVVAVRSVFWYGCGGVDDQYAANRRQWEMVADETWKGEIVKFVAGPNQIRLSESGNALSMRLTFAKVGLKQVLRLNSPYISGNVLPGLAHSHAVITLTRAVRPSAFH